MKKIRSKYQIWNDGKLVPAFCRKPKDPEICSKIIEIQNPTINEKELGIKYYLPE